MSYVRIAGRKGCRQREQHVQRPRDENVPGVSEDARVGVLRPERKRQESDTPGQRRWAEPWTLFQGLKL